MSMQPTRRRIEPGIFERIDPATGTRRGLEIYYKDASGKPRRRTVNGNLQDARDQLAEARTRRVKREREPADPRVTLNDVIDRFETSHVAGLRPNSQQSYRTALRRIRPALGAKRITAITRADVRKFVADEIADGLKANTIRGHYSALRTIYSFAAGDLDVPVIFPKLKASELPDPVQDQREHRILTDDELSAILAACPERSRLFFRLVAETGCRASEALGLTPQCARDGTVKFERQLARDRSLRPLKTRQSKRTVEITRGLSAELRLAGDRERVFPRLSHRDIERQWADALQGAGLDKPRPVIHDLRHTHASRLIAAGWDPVEIARRLGDRVETVLRVYTHAFDERRRSAERRAAIEGLYGAQDGYRMATDTPQQTATGGAKVQSLRAHRSTP